MHPEGSNMRKLCLLTMLILFVTLSVTARQGDCPYKDGISSHYSFQWRAGIPDIACRHPTQSIESGVMELHTQRDSRYRSETSLESYSGQQIQRRRRGHDEDPGAAPPALRVSAISVRFLRLAPGRTCISRQNPRIICLPPGSQFDRDGTEQPTSSPHAERRHLTRRRR